MRTATPPVDTKQSCEPVADWPRPDTIREILADLSTEIPSL
jgi:hypothetical protein